MNNYDDDEVEFDRHIRRELALEVDRIVRTFASRCHITFDTNAIQIIVFPRTGAIFQITGSPVTGTMRDGAYTE